MTRTAALVHVSSRPSGEDLFPGRRHDEGCRFPRRSDVVGPPVLRGPGHRRTGRTDGGRAAVVAGHRALSRAIDIWPDGSPDRPRARRRVRGVPERAAPGPADGLSGSPVLAAGASGVAVRRRLPTGQLHELSAPAPFLPQCPVWPRPAAPEGRVRLEPDPGGLPGGRASPELDEKLSATALSGSVWQLSPAAL